MRRVIPACGAALACALTLPAAASAATLINRNGTLTYTAAPGESNHAWVERVDGVDGQVHVLVEGAQITQTNCGPPGNKDTFCDDVTAIVADLGDGDDGFSVLDPIPASISAGPGDDGVVTSDADDVVSGGPGDDRLTVTPGDSVNGGTGIDGVSYRAGSIDPNASINLSFDGVANDGPSGGTGNLAEVEDILLFDAPSVTLTGNDAANDLYGGNRDDVITGGGGPDRINAYGGDDRVEARDGVADTIVCGVGGDTVVADQFDQIADSCERVEVAYVVPAAEDRAPTVTWASGPVGATLRVTAADDRGIANVRFLDGTRVLCTDTTAPYSCSFRPRAADVGRNTLLAIVTDTAGQTATAVRTVNVRRFTPRAVSLRVKRDGDRYTATGRVRLPAGLRCSGSVRVRARSGSRTVAARSDRIGRSCTYRAVITAAGGSLRFTATFEGTDSVAPKRSATRRAA